MQTKAPGKDFRYERIAADLRGRIDSGDWGDGQRLPAESELARRYGVNRLTLRKSLSILEADGLVIRQKGRGTFVRDGLSSKAGGLLYVGDFASHFYKEFYLAFAEEGQRSAHPVFAYDPARHEGNAVREELERYLNQARATVCQAGYEDLVDQLKPPRMAPPVVFGFHDAVPSTHAHVVQPDFIQAGILATDHLLELGHRRIAYIGVHPDPSTDVGDGLPDVHWITSVYQGFRLALLRQGVEDYRALGYYGISSKNPEVLDLLDRFLNKLDGWATAFVCDADFRAADLYRALERRGQSAPDDVSLVSLGNTPWAEALAPPLTSVDFGEREMARLAARLGDAAVPERCITYTIAPNLIARESARRIGESAVQCK